MAIGFRVGDEVGTRRVGLWIEGKKRRAGGSGRLDMRCFEMKE